MTKVSVLGVSGQIARWTIQMLPDRPKVELTFFLRDVSKPLRRAPGNAKLIHGNVLNSEQLSREQLSRAIAGQDVVYANLAGDIDDQPIWA